jgi:hypothetical protein
LNIRSFELVVSLIEKYEARGHGIFEGILIATSLGG